MAVTWVAGTSVTNVTADTSVSANAPAGIQDDDTLLAAVFVRSAATTPSGWTKVAETAEFVYTSLSIAQRIAVFSKDTVTTADASASFTFSQASSGRMGVCYAVARGVVSLEDTATTILSDQSGVVVSITPSVLTATEDNSLLLVFASNIVAVATNTPVAPTGFTLFTDSSATGIRLAGAYQIVDEGESNTGTFNMDSDPDPTMSGNGLGAVTLLLAPEPIVVVSAHVAVPGVLGSPGVVAVPVVAAVVSVASVLQAPNVVGLHDFTGHLDDAAIMRYVMDLETPGGLVRVPISSWQATLQTDVQSYVQCVIPAATAWVPDIEAATEFVISRVGILLDGSSIEYEMARAPAQTVSLDGGSYNYTATVSGYTAALDAVEDPPAALDRTLTGVRTVSRNSGNVRVRCNIDWLLRPGQRAYLNDEPIVVSYVNYYVPGFDQYMDVGDRAA